MIEYMTAAQIGEALGEIGDTGTAQLRQGNGLYTQREENTPWLFVGTVEDADEAQRLIAELFNQ